MWSLLRHEISEDMVRWVIAFKILTARLVKGEMRHPVSLENSPMPPGCQAAVKSHWNRDDDSNCRPQEDFIKDLYHISFRSWGPVPPSCRKKYAQQLCWRLVRFLLKRCCYGRNMQQSGCVTNQIFNPSDGVSERSFKTHLRKQPSLRLGFDFLQILVGYVRVCSRYAVTIGQYPLWWNPQSLIG